MGLVKLNNVILCVPHFVFKDKEWKRVWRDGGSKKIVDDSSAEKKKKKKER